MGSISVNTDFLALICLKSDAGGLPPSDQWLIIQGELNQGRVCENAGSYGLKRKNHPWVVFMYLAPRPGLEPGTYGLTATAGLRKSCRFNDLHG
jgi:hypothetical protein